MSHITKATTRRRWAATAAAIAGALVLSACSTPATPDPTAEPVRGGEVVYVEGSAVKSWDPKAMTGTNPGIQTDRLAALYDFLVYTDETGAINGGMAESLTTEDDGATWTLVLKPGIEFSDGTPYDAEAVKYNWDRIGAEGSGAVSQALASTFTSEVVDDVTLSITMSTPNTVFDFYVAEFLPFIASPTALETADETFSQPIGAGPFTLTSWDPTTGEVMTRNETYFAAENVCADTLRFSVVTDPVQRVATAASGEGDIVAGYRFIFQDYVDAPGTDIVDVDFPALRTVMFNMKAAPFDDPRARLAVALAIDPQGLNAALTVNSDAVGATGLFPEESPYYDADLTQPEYSLDAAQELVDELAADGKPLAINILYSNIPEYQRSAQYVESALAELSGVSVTLTPADLADHRRIAFSEDNFQLTFRPGVTDLNVPQTSLAGLLGTGGAENYSNYSSPEMDDLLADVAAATTDEARVEAIAAVQELYLEDLPVWVFGIDSHAFFVTDTLTGITPAGRGVLLAAPLCAG